MKKVYCFLLGWMLVWSVAAQNYNPEGIVPIDPDVKVGKLDNGLTYYIRKNSKPANRADMYIVNHVGALLEEDRQNGLAHFTEHMAFKGTTNFPGDAITKYCEKNGIKFGANLNAFTSMDRTCYMLSSVPLDRSETLVDSLLLILHDWSGSFTFSPEMLEIERGVIREEWRTYGGYQFRIGEQLNPVMYNNSQYSKRNVIGTLDVLNNFKMNDILDFYHKWYRADLQALILVGDFDPNQMEAKVKRIFADLPKPQGTAKFPEFEIPDNDEMLIGKATDPEAGNLGIRVLFKQEGTKREDRAKEKFMYNNRVTRLINNMLSARFDELYLSKDQPFTSAYGYYSSWIESKDAFWGSVSPKNGQAPAAFNTLLTELERVKRYGFTESELERAKADLLNQEQRSYNERNNRDNGVFWGMYSSHFTGSNSIPSIEYTYNFTRNVLPMITLDEVNNKAKSMFPEKNRVVTQSVSDKDKDQMLEDAQIKKMLTDIQLASIEPYKDQMSGKKLISKEPKSGKIVKTKQLKKPFEATEWTLSNGAKVIVYPTTHKDDQILLSAYSFGGSSLVSDQDFPSCQYATNIAMLSGIADFSYTDLSKLLAGKTASVYPYISDTYEGVSGSSSKKDVETMFQLLYLRFNQPRFDPEILTTTLQRTRESIRQRANDPANHFADSASWITIGRHPRRKPVNEADLEKVNMPAIEKVYKARFADAGDFVFFLVGSFTADEVKPLVEKYIASLPGLKSNEKWKNSGMHVPKGEIVVDFSKPMLTPKASARIRYSGTSKYDLTDMMNMSGIREVLSKRYLETIRKEYGATYGVGVGMTVWPAPNYNYTLDMNFNTDPNLADKMIKVIYDEIDKLVAEGPDAETIDNAKKYWLKSFKDNQKENSWYMYIWTDFYREGIDRYTDYEKVVESITPESVHKTAKKALTQGNMIRVVMRPEEKELAN